MCYVQRTRCLPHPVPYSVPSKLSPEFTSSPPRQLTTEYFSWIYCCCMKSPGVKKLWSFRQLKSCGFFKTWGGLWTGGRAMKIKEDSGKCANGISFTKLMGRCLFSLSCEWAAQKAKGMHQQSRRRDKTQPEEWLMYSRAACKWKEQPFYSLSRLRL